MRTAAISFVLLITLAGCARKSELESTRANLTEAQKQLQSLERDRVPRIQYDRTRASLKIAEERIATLERELQDARTRPSEHTEPKTSDGAASAAGSAEVTVPQELRLAGGGYAQSNDTLVYSEDAQLEFGSHLKISSPSGLMVTDPDRRVVGGDLTIKAREMTLETADGLLMTDPDGSVKFIGSTLTMKFPAKKSVEETKLAPTASPTATAAPVTSEPTSQTTEKGP